MSDGVLVGCDHNFEWLIPWWWMTYSLHNTAPVTFVDMGNLSDNMKKWCRQRGEVKTLKMPKNFVLKEVDPALMAVWIDYRIVPFRKIWFMKPFAMQLSSYDRTAWIDLDIHVQVPVEEMFPYCENGGGFSMTKEPKYRQEFVHRRKQIPEEESLYNGGVVVYKKDSSLLQLWIEEIRNNNHKYLADQECISHLLATSGIPFTPLCPRYNWFIDNWDKATEPVNYHYLAQFKELIRTQITEMSKTFYFNFSV